MSDIPMSFLKWMPYWEVNIQIDLMKDLKERIDWQPRHSDWEEGNHGALRYYTINDGPTDAYFVLTDTPIGK